MWEVQAITALRGTWSQANPNLSHNKLLSFVPKCSRGPLQNLVCGQKGKKNRPHNNRGGGVFETSRIYKKDYVMTVAL